VNNGGVRLHPYPAAIFGEKPKVPRSHLTFEQHCETKTTTTVLLTEVVGGRT